MMKGAEMYTTNPNGTTNYKWHLAHDIRQSIAGMSDVEKQNTLLRIQTELTLGTKTPDPDLLQYITSLLNGKRPKNGIARRR
jgi:hypothetical protein